MPISEYPNLKQLVANDMYVKFHKRLPNVEEVNGVLMRLSERSIFTRLVSHWNIPADRVVSALSLRKRFWRFDNHWNAHVHMVVI